MITQVVIGLVLCLCSLVTGLVLGRRRAYRNAARSVWPATTERDGRGTIPTAELPAASRRALLRRQRANRADLREALRR